MLLACLPPCPDRHGQSRLAGGTGLICFNLHRTGESCGFATQTSAMSGPPKAERTTPFTRLRSFRVVPLEPFPVARSVNEGKPCRACSWHAFLRAQIDTDNPDRRVAQTSPDVCVRSTGLKPDRAGNAHRTNQILWPPSHLVASPPRHLRCLGHPKRNAPRPSLAGARSGSCHPINL